MTEKNCNQHQQPIQWQCAACSQDLCPACQPISNEGKTLCHNCDATSGGIVEAIVEKEQGFEKNLIAFEIFVLVGTVLAFFSGIVLGLMGIKRTSPNSWMRWLPLGLYLIGYIYFFITLLCPKCGCFLVFYYGGNIIEVFRFRNCPRCGHGLRD